MIRRIFNVFWGVVVLAGLVVGCGENSAGVSNKKAQKDARPSAASVQKPRLEIAWRVGEGVTDTVNAQILEGITREMLNDAVGGLAGLQAGLIVVSGLVDAAGEDHRVIVEGDLRADNLELALHAGVAAAGQVASEGELERLVRNAVRDLERALGEMVALSRKDRAAWRRALLSSEPDIQVFACRLLAVHKETAAMADIAALLRDPRPQVAEAAAGALVAIGSQDAVPLLLENIERGDLRSEVRVIEALGKLGGDEAVSYLEMVAEGHEIPEVRRVAGLALETARSNR